MIEFRRLTLWQQMASPHLSPLLGGLAPRFDRVRLVTLGEMDETRTAIGWDETVPPGVEWLQARNSSERSALLQDSTRAADLHLLQGLKPLRSQIMVQNALRESPAAIVLMSELPWPGATAASRFALKLREVVLTRYWRRRAHALFAFGEEAAEHYRRCGFPIEKIHPFFYVPPLSDERPRSRPHHEPIIAVAARLSFYKGVDILLRALGSISSQSWRLQVAGDGPMRPMLENLAKEVGVADRVEWLGWRSAHTVPRLFADADLMVLPSRHEGWGAVVNEALGVGTPVVVSRGAGAHCLVRDPLLGETVGPGDAEALAQAISRQLERPGSARRDVIRTWSRQRISPAVAADYFVARLEGASVLPPWTW